MEHTEIQEATPTLGRAFDQGVHLWMKRLHRQHTRQLGRPTQVLPVEREIETAGASTHVQYQRWGCRTSPQLESRFPMSHQGTQLPNSEGTPDPEDVQASSTLVLPLPLGPSSRFVPGWGLKTAAEKQRKLRISTLSTPVGGRHTRPRYRRIGMTTNWDCESPGT